MNSPIKIKSSSNGIRIVMDPDSGMEELEREFRQKMTDGRKFFGNMKIALSFEGKELTEAQQDHFCDIIMECTDIDIICVADLPAAGESLKGCIRAVKDEFKQNDVCFIKHSIIDQEFIDTDKDVIIIGDVHPGCTVISSKSIFVFGSLYGEAYAGINDNESHIRDSGEIILAVEMAPEELRIGSLCYEPAKKPRWGLKPKFMPQIAYVSNDKINIEPYTKELLKRIVK